MQTPCELAIIRDIVKGDSMKFNKLALAGPILFLAACTPSLNLEVAIPRPSPAEFTVVLEADATTGTFPLPVVFTAVTPESATYAWFINDRKVSTKRSILTYTFKEPGSYEVTVASTNTAGNADTDSVVIEVVDMESEVVDAGI